MRGIVSGDLLLGSCYTTSLLAQILVHLYYWLPVDYLNIMDGIRVNCITGLRSNVLPATRQ